MGWADCTIVLGGLGKGLRKVVCTAWPVKVTEPPIDVMAK
jgi:hypothetical protein